MIANHPTLVDVTALVATHPNMVIVVKRAMYRSPLLGRLLRYCGHIDAGDGGVFSGVAVMARALERLDDGISVLIFPEGTRSPERGLGRFQAGAFQIATRAQVPVVPVVITCEPPMLMRGQPWYSVPARTAEMRVTQLPSIPLNGDDPGLQAERIRDLFAERVLATAGALPPIDLSTSPALVAGP
jgi:1-acyl-sn-glycerol-3-phosphate acyltransferase